MLEFHRIADSVFWSFGINELMCSCSKYMIPLKDLLGEVARGSGWGEWLGGWLGGVARGVARGSG